MNILVMGGSGFVGHAIVRALMAEGHALSLLNRGSRPVPGTEQLTADRNDPSALRAVLEGRGFDAVVDSNCYSGAQARALIAALGGRVPSAAVISSAAVYADEAAHPPTEAEPTGGGSAWGDYGRGKTEMEQAWRDGGFVSAVALRPPYIIGPNDNLDRETWFFRRILAGRPVLVPGRGTAEYQFVHEDDLGAAVCTWLRHRPEGFEPLNVADPRLVPAVELPRMLARAAGRTADIRLAGASAGDARPRDWFPFRDVNCAVDPSAIRTRFGWTPATTLEERFAQIFRHLDETGGSGADDWTPLEARILSRLAPEQG